MFLKNASRRIRRDIDIVAWQKQATQHDIKADLMQREWDVLARRCLGGEGGKGFVREEIRNHEEEHGGEEEREEEMPPEVGDIITQALEADEAVAAWKGVRRAARTSRAGCPEVIGTVACEMIERWGWVEEHIHRHQDIKDLCEQEGLEGNQWGTDGVGHTRQEMRKMAGELPLKYISLMASKYRLKSEETVQANREREQNIEEREREDGRPMDEEADQEPFMPEGEVDLAHAFEGPPHLGNGWGHGPHGRGG